MKLHRLLHVVLLVTCGFRLVPAHALDVGTPVASYRHDVFDARAGAPRGAITMAQTADGWLWLGTPSGLYRYDGLKFEAFQPLAGEHLLGQYITALRAHPNGDLWISYVYGGISVLHAGHLRHLPAAPGKPVGSTPSLAFDGDDLWAASSTGLFRYRRGHWQRFGGEHGFPEDLARFVYRDHYGRVWATNTFGVYLLDRSADRFERVMDVVSEAVVVASPDGRVWAADGTTVHLLPAPPGGWRTTPKAQVAGEAQQTLFDRDGNYWTGNCPVGLCVLRPAHQQTARGGFPDLTRKGVRNDGEVGNTTVLSTLEDRDGNIWIATRAGVERLRDTRLVPLTLPPPSGWPSMALDAEGTAWIASTNMSTTGRLWKVADGSPVEQQPGQASALVARGRGGTVLVAGPRWIERRLGAHVLARYPMPVSARDQLTRSVALLLAEDRDGLWLYQGGKGLLHLLLPGGSWQAAPAQSALARAIYAFVDDAGAIWFGTRDNRVVMLDGDRRREFGPGDGIALGAVTFVDVHRERVISGDKGTAVWQDGRFRPLLAEGVDLANVSGLVATADGDRWLSTMRGLLRVKAADWRRSMADPRQPLRGSLLEELDGFPGAGHGISPVPTLRLDGGGRLWVSGTDGVSILDRAQQPGTHGAAPRAELLALVADGRRYQGGVPATLAPRTERLRFDFTAPSLSKPEKLRFRYRLSGYDHAWLDAGAARSASYTNLGPGDYRFEVQAIDEEGAAGPVAATRPFQIAPTVFQTRWFAALCVLAVGLAAWLLYRWRLGRIQRTCQVRMDERLGERERIARTLHDTFLQSLHGLIFHVDAVATRLPADSGERAQMENLLAVARKVTAEGRNQVLDLRTEGGHADLQAALAASVDELRTGQDVQLSLRQLGEAQQLAPATRQEVEAIAREAIANVFRHAKARRLDITIDWRGPALLLRVADDGVGMPSRLLLRGRPGHWGLRGMRERAARIGAALSLRNRGGGGVEIVLDLGAAKPVWQRTIKAWIVGGDGSGPGRAGRFNG
jgi:ligand-binding sensor domain-containing protein